MSAWEPLAKWQCWLQMHRQHRAVVNNIYYVRCQLGTRLTGVTTLQAVQISDHCVVCLEVI